MIIFLVFFPFVEAEGVCPNPNNITCPDFQIDLGQIDPMHGAWGGVTPAGKQALIGPGGILEKVANLLLFVIPIIAAVSLIIAGYYYILSSGDTEKASQAKTIIKWNLVAIVVALFSYAIISLLANLLGGGL